MLIRQFLNIISRDQNSVNSEFDLTSEDSDGRLVVQTASLSYTEPFIDLEETMNLDVISLGELLVEIMRKDLDKPLDKPADFVGPFPSGAPAIFIDAVARLGVPTGFIGVIGGS